MGAYVIRQPLVRYLLLLFSLVACAPNSGLPGSRAPLSPDQIVQLRCAAANQSTAPSYVWLDVYDSERNLSWSTVRESIALHPLIRSNPEATVVVSSNAGFDLTPRYDADLLLSARRHLDGFSDEEIDAGLTRATQFGSVRSFINDNDHSRYQEALAHALFERGFFPSRGDFTPTLYATRTVCVPKAKPRADWNDVEEIPAQP